MNFTVRLFLGFPIDGILAHQLENVPSAILDSFISEGDNYLQDIEDNGVRYLGKFSDSCTELRDLELLESNIYSLLKKIEPNYLFHHTPLVLLAKS
jgi:hypothetical protein